MDDSPSQAVSANQLVVALVFNTLNQSVKLFWPLSVTTLSYTVGKTELRVGSGCCAAGCVEGLVPRAVDGVRSDRLDD